jgi:hypothetical protein
MLKKCRVGTRIISEDEEVRSTGLLCLKRKP